MELYLQMGHGMKTMSLELIKKWGDGCVIISPVNIKEDEKLFKFSNDVHKYSGKVLFDPQLFVLSEAHPNLKSYKYWPSTNTSIISEDVRNLLNSELLKLNTKLKCDEIILPGKLISEQQINSEVEQLKLTSKYFRDNTDLPLLATICLQSESIRNHDYIEKLIEKLRDIDIDGYYIIPSPANHDYLVSDNLWTIGILKLITCLKLQNRKVVIGYSNHQGLMYGVSKADAIASGNFMNTRSFNPSKFKSIKDDEFGRRSIWYYHVDSLSEYKISVLDFAKQRGILTRLNIRNEFANDYSAILFKGENPSSTNYNETDSFKHYLTCLRIQCLNLVKSNYLDTLNNYLFILKSAELILKELRDSGVTGQNRDFKNSIEPNRVAVLTTDRDYGFKISLDWDNI